MIWDDDVLARLESVVGCARLSRPTALVVEAEAGLGKTALLTALVSTAADFRVVRADGLQDDQSPYTLLSQWGVEPARQPNGGHTPARVAARALGDRLDEWAATGPVLLIADDLHWADPESVDALVWLLRRISGARLLVAVANRPLPAEVHSGWQRWIANRGQAIRVRLSGLTEEQVKELARQQWPHLSDELARRLHEHTDGNPLYLSTLLAERDQVELSRAGVLPAPSAFARSIALRTSRLSGPAMVLLRAVCVLGSSWTPLPLAAATAGVEEAALPTQELTDFGLLEVRRLDGPAELRPAHALIRASVHEQTPLPELRSLNARAASLVFSRAAELQHRMAAAEQYDPALADDLEFYAAQLYDQRSFRQAGQFLRWASALTAAPAVRERRWLESVYDQVLAHDFTTFDAEWDGIRASGDPLWRALVLGLADVWRRKYQGGVEHLQPEADRPVQLADPRARYRIEILLAWAHLCLGRPTSVIAAGLDRAATVRVEDVGLSNLEMIARSQLSIRTHGIGPVLQQLSTLPAPAAVPIQASGALAFRGALRAALGLIREATDDLLEVTRRVIDGSTTVGAGSFHAQLAHLYWLAGDWSRAQVGFRQAFDLAAPAVHQMTAAFAPVVDISAGRFPEADATIARTRALLTASPWLEPCQHFAATLLLRVHAGGSAADQASALDTLRGGPFEPDADHAGPVLLLQFVPALISANRLDEANAALDRWAKVRWPAPWATAVRSWYRGLLHAARGDLTAAWTALTRALAEDLELPLYRAHLLVDHARLARQTGRPGADESLRQADKIYRRLGAEPYVQRVRQLRSVPPERVRTLPGGVTLTEREQDVLTLLVGGMSYAQISRELFITQSTVGYHLGNTYGKAGVTSRHQLTAMARKDPQLFGISLGS